MIDRLSLIQILNGIPQEQLLQVIFTLKPPSGIIPPNSASQGQQVFALLQWAEGSFGCGLEEVQAVLDAIIKLPNHSKAVVDPITETAVNHSKSSQIQVQPQSTMPNSLKYILHLSDLHFSKTWHLPLTLEDQADIWSSKLIQDLRNNLKPKQIDVLVLSGDITHFSTSEEYAAAKKFLDNLRENFPLKREQIIIVPGNHDLNWDKSKEAYDPKRIEDYKGQKINKNGKEIPDPNCTIYKEGNDYVEVQNEEKYKQRFAYFSEFYKDITGKPYPLDYDQQAIIYHLPNLNLLILGLNSAWDLNHDDKNPKRASINMTALSKAIAEIGRNPLYHNCLKFAVWHHPVTGLEMMNNSFMQSLADDDFQVCLHGHIHEAIEDLYKYDNKRKPHIIGAGTFGAPVREQVTGIPLQYNLLALDLQNWQITVNTRKKEKNDGAWAADARWGDKNRPLPEYTIELRELALNPSQAH